MIELLQIQNKPKPKNENTLLLMHFDKVGTRDYVCECGTKINVPANAQLITSNYKKIGDGSALSGNSAAAVPGVIFDHDFGLGDFTFEFWFRISGNSPRQQNVFYGLAPNARKDVSLYFDGSDRLTAYYNNAYIAAGLQINLYRLAWCHTAFVKEAGKLKVFQNGILRSTTTLDTPFRIRQFSLPIAFGSYLSHVDELRISKVARYTTDFTPQTTPFELD